MEPALKGRVLFNVKSIFIERGRTHTSQLAAGQHRFEHVCGIKRAFGFARPNQRVQFIDEEDDLTFTVLDLVKNSLQTVFKLAAILGSSDQCAHIQRNHALVAQAFRDVTLHDTLG